MKKVVVGGLAVCVSLLLGAGVASACGKVHGGHGGKSMKVVSATKDGVTLAFTSDAGDAEAVAALQTKFAEKVEKYNKGEAPCGKCKAKACPFKVAGLTLAATNVEKGVEIKATGDAKKLKAFARAARLHHKSHKVKHGHGKGHACKSCASGAAGEGCSCGKKAAEPKTDGAAPSEKKADEKKTE
ncbi:MAG: hypothetical protein HYY84_04030 [Deltaproteobacteria bacterium]|nr:hypothetical protein [Deltaproteobacteria bacterium]